MLALAILALLALAAAGLALFAAWVAGRVQSAVPPLGDFLELEGSRLHFVDTGQVDADKRPAILLIHGLGATLRSFTYAVVDELKGRYRVIAVDRPGSGYSTRPCGRAGVAEEAKLLARFIEAKGLHRPLVVGHSLGGAIALSLALDHPRSVGGLALISPLTHLPESVPEPFSGLVIRSRGLRWLISWTLATPIQIARRHATLAVIFGPDPVPPDFATRGGGLLGMRPCAFYSTSTDLVAVSQDPAVLTDLANRYAGLALPIGILYGTADRVLDPKVHANPMLEKIAGLQLELIEGGGHMPPISAPRRTLEFIQRMAAKVA